MDMTQDYHAKINDNTSRKSLGRRVSFAEHAHVRMFEKPDTNHTNSTGSPQSSPVVDSSSHQNVVTDENAYHRPTPFAGRHSSSVRYRKSEDMDLTSVGPLSFPISSGTAGSAILDEDLDDVDDDMEVTEVIKAELLRKRSLSLRGRQPLSQVGSSILSADELSDDLEETRSSIGNDSTTSDMLSDRSQAMEFTIPLNQSLRPPAHEDKAWLALRQATHSGNTPIEPMPASDDDQDYPASNGMDLGDAVQRLMRARDSLSHPSYNEEDTPDEMVQHIPHDETFSSVDDSFEADADDGDRTMNISKVLGRASLNDAANARMSMGYQDSTMDESEIYATFAPKGSSIPRSSLLQQNLGGPSGQQLLKPSVFQPPPAGVDTQPLSATGQTKQATTPIPFSFTPKAPASPSKSKPSTSKLDSPAKRKIKPVFSAAFAPPVTRSSPKKIATFSNSRQPNKRPRDEDVENHPSPAKSQPLAEKCLGGLADASTESLAAAMVTNTARPKPLSPSKKALFQAPVVTTSASQTAPAVRRPSGYYARRKSLAPVHSIIPNKGIEDVLVTVKSPKKKLDSGIGRASVGSTSVIAWDRASVSQKGKETSKAGEVDKLVVLPSTRGATQQPAVSSPTRESLTTTSPRVNSAALLVQPSSVVDFSTIVTSGFGDDEEADMDVDATEQWREGVEQGEYFEDDLVNPFSFSTSTNSNSCPLIARHFHYPVLFYDWD
jgi:kinetochore protein Spc7/SPC105